MLSPMQQALVNGDFDALSRIGQEKSSALETRIRSLHAAQYQCDVWEVWTERNVPLVGGGKADVTYDGCRKHKVACAR